MKYALFNVATFGVIALAVTAPAYANVAAPEPEVAGGLVAIALLGIGAAALRRFKR